MRADTSVRLLAIVDPGCSASTRYRVTQFGDYLQSRGVDLQAVPWSAGGSHNVLALKDLLAAVEQADFVLFQRYLPNSTTLRAIRARAARLIYDFDDAVIYSESTRGKPRRRLIRSLRFRRMVRCCDAVTAGNEYLAGLARRYAPPGRVHVLPTVVDMSRYELVSDPHPDGNGADGQHPGHFNGNGKPEGSGNGNGHNRSALPAASPTSFAPSSSIATVAHPPPDLRTGPLIGWIGSTSTLPYLEALRSPLDRLSHWVPGLTVRVIADRRPDLGKTPVEWLRWSSDTEVQDLRRLRVGLAPLPDDPWTRGKCGLRLLQYLAADVPAVASPVGMQNQITDSGAALPARSDDDWVEALRRLLADPQLAADLAGRGRQLLRERFAASALADSMYSIWCRGA